MGRKILRDRKWIESILLGKKSDVGVPAKDNRLFVEAALWIAITGSPWRDLPEEYGHWHRVYVRFNRWSHKGMWSKVFEELSKAGDFEYVMIDGSVVRVHQHSAAEKVQQDDQAQGKSIGGLSTKIHAVVDALGNPIKLEDKIQKLSRHKL